MNIIERELKENFENKLKDLRSVIGQISCQNFSPTLYAKLVSVTPQGCIWESVQGKYRNYPADKVGVRFSDCVEFSWNCFFY